MIITLKSRSIGEIKLDATTSEAHTSEMTITDNPIESGALVSDHAIRQPAQVTITGVVVDYVPPTFSLALPQAMAGASGANRLLSVLPQMSVRLPDTVRKAAQIYEDFKVVDDFFNSNFNPYFKPEKSSASSSGTRIGKQQHALIELQRNPQLITVNTGARIYNDMAVLSVGVTQDKDGAGVFTVTLRELKLVDLVSAGVERSTIASAAGRAGTQAAGAVTRTVQPEPPKKSALKSLVGGSIGDIF